MKIATPEPDAATMPTTGRPALDVSGLVIRYGEIEAVRDLSLRVAPGSCLGLLGPNGAGKTSTLSAIEGLITPHAGTIEVCGIDVAAHTSAARSRLGVQLQELSLWQELSITELVRYYAAFHNCHLSKAAALAHLDRFQLGDKAKQRAEQLSGGQRRRLGIAIAVAHEPDLVLLDEPTTGLDPRVRRQTWELIGKLRGGGMTILLTTHYIEEAELLCDQVALIDEGRLLAEGTPEELVAASDGAATIHASVIDAAAAADQLAHRPEVVSVSAAGPSLTVRTRDPDQTQEAVRALAGLRSFTTRPANLEDVFLAMTGRALSDDDDDAAGEETQS